MRHALALPILALLAGPAWADVAPEPGELEARLAQRVRNAGHSCTEPAEFERLTESDRAAGQKRSLGVHRLRCANGSLYLVAVPGRRQRNPPPGFVHRLNPP